jgi:hypothetical protein
MTKWALTAVALWLSVARGAWAATWEPVVGETTEVGGRPGAAQLQATAAQETWAASAPLEAVVAGTPVQVSLLVRRVEGDGELALALSDAAATPTRPLLWVASGIKDTYWHRVALVVVCGLEQPRLLCGVVGGAGTWQVDDVRTSAATVRPTKVAALGSAPTYSAGLKGTEDLTGDLDLQRRTIMGETSYTLRSGALEMNPVRDVTLRRGERTGVTLDVLSRGNAKKALDVAVQGPAGWRTEAWRVMVAGSVRLGLSLPLQGMTVGTSDLMVEYTCDGQTRRAPLRVRTERHYPLLGAWWANAPSGEGLAAIAGLGAQFHEVPADDPGAWATADALADGILRDWRASPAAAKVLKETGDAAKARLGGVVLAEGSTEETAAGVGAFRSAFPDAVVVTPTIVTKAADDGLQLGNDAHGAVNLAQRGLADAVGLQLPALPRAAVVQETVDGKSSADGMAAWQHFDTAMDSARLRQELTAAGAALPLYWRLPARGGTGVQGMDTLLLARAAIEAFSWGAAGLCVDAGRLSADGGGTSSVGEAYGELIRELAGVRALAAPAPTAVAGTVAGRPVTFRPFVRGDEGIVALWNNTSVTQRLAVEIRCRPTQVRLLRLSYPGTAWQREFVGDFDWDPLAKRYKQAAVYVDLAPLQVAVLSLKMLGTNAQWLREVGPRPAAPPVVDPMSREEFDKALWGPK